MTALIVQGKMSCLMINDIDAGLGRFGELYFHYCFTFTKEYMFDDY